MSEYIHPYDLSEGDEQHRLHVGRYKWAAEMLKGLVVANAACSTNYGSPLLAKPGRLVIGFDRNQTALGRARKEGRDLVIDKDIQCETFEGFSSIVSLETIEHLPDPKAFVSGWSKTVRECVISVPIIPTKHFNEWHLHDFTKEEARALLTNNGWKIEAEAYQDESGLAQPTYILLYATR